MNLKLDMNVKPGEMHDIKGVPIYPGDLVRTFHFIGARRKKNYLYHVVTERDGKLWVTPVQYLHKRTGGGECMLYVVADDPCLEVLAGHGPEECLCYSDRPKKKDG